MVNMRFNEINSYLRVAFVLQMCYKITMEVHYEHHDQRRSAGSL